MSRLPMLQLWMATVVLSTGVAFVPGVAADSVQTFTGSVSIPAVYAAGDAAASGGHRWLLWRAMKG
jgi:hypothetical protein